MIFSWGAYSADIYSDYLTDSINFRIYVGKHDQDINYFYHCSNDSISIIKLFKNSHNIFMVTDTLATYDLKALKKKNR